MTYFLSRVTVISWCSLLSLWSPCTIVSISTSLSTRSLWKAEKAIVNGLPDVQRRELKRALPMLSQQLQLYKM